MLTNKPEEHEAQLVRKAAEETEAVGDPTATGASDPLEIARRHAQGETAKHPHSIGSPEIIEIIGQGGMGVVYLAGRDEPVIPRHYSARDHRDRAKCRWVRMGYGLALRGNGAADQVVVQLVAAKIVFA